MSVEKKAKQKKATSIQAHTYTTWRNEYDRKLVVDDVDLLSANFDPISLTLQRQNGTRYKFTFNGSTWVSDADVNFQVVRLSNATTGTTGWQVTTPEGFLETYAITGNLNAIYSSSGGVLTFGYDANLHLISVTDTFGRKFTLGWNATTGRISTITTPDNYVYNYAYDAIGNLSTVTYPGIPSVPPRTYFYNEAVNTGNNVYPNFLTGITDEDTNRFATFKYDSTKKAIQSTHAGGADQTSFVYNIDGTVGITSALGSVSTYTYITVNGARLVSGRSQAAGAGYSASSSTVTYDVNSNAASQLDFNGMQTCRAFDLTRNLETTRVEGLPSSALCSTALATPPAPTTANPVRVISTQWHPNWRLEARRAEPRKLTIWVYNGQPDPTNANAILTCAPATAVIGSLPIATLCKRVEQPTTDSTGVAGFAAIATGTPRSWSYTYNQYGQILTVDGPRTDVIDKTTYVYYPSTDATGRWTLGDLQSITDGLNHVTQFTLYDKNGRPLTVLDPNGVTTTLTYKPRGWLASRTVGTLTTLYTYDNLGQLTRVTLPDSSHLDYTWDAAHRLTDISNAKLDHIHYTLNNKGKRTKEDVYDANVKLSRTHSRVYDPLNRLAQDISAYNATTSYTTNYSYDPNGNFTQVVDAKSHATVYGYDALNRLIQSTDAALGISKYSYDGLDQLSNVTDPKSFNTLYTVNALGYETQRASPDSGTANRSYDSAGNLATATDARGIAATLSYDVLNRPATISFPATGENIAYTWDAAVGCNFGIGRLCQVTDADGSTVFAYDNQGNLTQMTRTEQGVNFSTRYAYDGANRPITVITPTGETISLTRDSAGYVQQVLDTSAAGTSFFGWR